jgi:hypothetical protein
MKPRLDAPWRTELDALASAGRFSQQVKVLGQHAEALRLKNPELAAAALFEAASIFMTRLANQSEATKCIDLAKAMAGDGSE